jgi:hypothetical protein
MLWLEWEIQYMLKSMGRSDYHEFRFHYWNWTDSDRDSIFKENRLGISDPETAEVSGNLFGENGWNTICWQGNDQDCATCDPRNPTAILRRCPIGENNTDYCFIEANWPTTEHINQALSKSEYDTNSFDIEADRDSFRNFMEGFEIVGSDVECNGNTLCSETDTGKIVL